MSEGGAAIIHERFIHIHIPRTGGSLVRGLIQELLINSGKLAGVDDSAHVRLYRARKVCPSAPAFTFVRNPWDWYTSSWSREVEMGGWEVTFREYLENCPSFTWWWEQMGCEDIEPGLIGRYENLVTEIDRILGTLFPDLLTHEEIWAAIARIGPARATSWRVPYPFYYRTQEAIGLVCHKDKELIQRFGYEFPGEETVSFPEGLATGRLLVLLKRSLGLE